MAIIHADMTVAQGRLAGVRVAGNGWILGVSSDAEAPRKHCPL